MDVSNREFWTAGAEWMLVLWRVHGLCLKYIVLL